MWQNYSGRLLVALKMRHGTTLIGWCCRRTSNLSDNVRLRPIRRLQEFLFYFLFFIFGVGVRDPCLGGEGGSMDTWTPPGSAAAWDNITVPRKITRTKRYNEESWQSGRHTPNTGIYSKATLPSAWRDMCTTRVCCQLWHYVAETWTLTKQAQNKLAAAQIKMERSLRSKPHTRIEGQHLGQRVSNVRKWNGPGQCISTASKTAGWPRTWPLGDHTTRKCDKGDQPSGGEMTWTNTGATRSHKIG